MREVQMWDFSMVCNINIYKNCYMQERYPTVFRYDRCFDFQWFFHMNDIGIQLLFDMRDIQFSNSLISTIILILQIFYFELFFRYEQYKVRYFAIRYINSSLIRLQHRCSLSYLGNRAVQDVVKGEGERQ